MLSDECMYTYRHNLEDVWYVLSSFFIFIGAKSKAKQRSAMSAQ